jgi:hypothetical protein
LYFAHQTVLTPKIFSVVALCGEADTHLTYQSDGDSRFVSDSVTYLPAYSGWTKVTSNIIITTLRTSDHILFDTEQFLKISTII